MSLPVFLVSSTQYDSVEDIWFPKEEKNKINQETIRFIDQTYV